MASEFINYNDRGFGSSLKRKPRDTAINVMTAVAAE
jgi:hypothetical protein